MARVDSRVPIIRIKADIQEFFQKKARGMQVEVASAEEMIDRMKQQMQMFSLLLGAIGSISLIVGGIGVMNVMLISVSERRSEIGLRRALGAQQSDIQSQFLIEAILLCLAGGLIGIILGVGISYLFSYFCKWQFITLLFLDCAGVRRVNGGRPLLRLLSGPYGGPSGPDQGPQVIAFWRYGHPPSERQGKKYH